MVKNSLPGSWRLPSIHRTASSNEEVMVSSNGGGLTQFTAVTTPRATVDAHANATSGRDSSVMLVSAMRLRHFAFGIGLSRST